MRLLLIRHGETDHNAEQIALGREDVPLNERGRQQAQALARAAKAGELPGPIAAVYSSPLDRALATASPLAEVLTRSVSIEQTLIEMDVGEVENQTFAELRERYPDFLRAWRSDDCADVSMPGGESLRQVQERAWALVESLRARHADETVVAVTHNFVILTLLCRVLGLPLGQFRRLRHDLGAVSLVDLTDERETVLALNDRCHLQD
ncbi:MAG: histidine phosphatase family protein [Dehalococcoidia bacterium]